MEGEVVEAHRSVCTRSGELGEANCTSTRNVKRRLLGEDLADAVEIGEEVGLGSREDMIGGLIQQQVQLVVVIWVPDIANLPGLGLQLAAALRRVQPREAGHAEHPNVAEVGLVAEHDAIRGVVAEVGSW